MNTEPSIKERRRDMARVNAIIGPRVNTFCPKCSRIWTISASAPRCCLTSGCDGQLLDWHGWSDDCSEPLKLDGLRP